MFSMEKEYYQMNLQSLLLMKIWKTHLCEIL